MKLPFQIDLSGKTIVVTGGAGVLCSGFCRALAECGAKVAVLDLHADTAKKLAEELVAAGGIAEGFRQRPRQSVRTKRRATPSRRNSARATYSSTAPAATIRAARRRKNLSPKTSTRLRRTSNVLRSRPRGVEFVFQFNDPRKLLPDAGVRTRPMRKKGLLIIQLS